MALKECLQLSKMALLPPATALLGAERILLLIKAALVWKEANSLIKLVNGKVPLL